eukprot:Opistho-2@66121
MDRERSSAGAVGDMPGRSAADRQSALSDLVDDAFLARKPLCTAALIVAVHGVFWHFATTERTVLSSVSYSMLVIASMRACTHNSACGGHISKVVSHVARYGGSCDSSYHAPVVAPMATEATAAVVLLLRRVWNGAVHLRTTQPSEFAKYTVVLLLSIGFVGSLVSGRLLLYIVVVVLMCVPAARHYDVIQYVGNHPKARAFSERMRAMLDAVVAHDDVDNSDIFGCDGALAVNPFELDDSIMEGSFMRTLASQGLDDSDAVAVTPARYSDMFVDVDAPGTPTFNASPSLVAFGSMSELSQLTSHPHEAHARHLLLDENSDDVDLSEYAVIDKNRLG